MLAMMQVIQIFPFLTGMKSMLPICSGTGKESVPLGTSGYEG
jgi:hypothetical protein